MTRVPSATRNRVRVRVRAREVQTHLPIRPSGNFQIPVQDRQTSSWTCTSTTEERQNDEMKAPVDDLPG